MLRTSIAATAFQGDVGCYVVYDSPDAERPLYVGVASRRGIDQRWNRDHLRNRAGSSALRRSLGVHLGLVDEKLRRPSRCYPEDVEAQITAALRRGYIELYPCHSEHEALAMELELIGRLDPLLNVRRN